MRRHLIQFHLIFAAFLIAATVRSERPNILIAISDDQSYPHASAYGDAAVSTPAFDRVAKAGVLFKAAFTPSPGCSPMRAAFLTGREIWQIREAGTHASSFPTDLPVFPSQLEKSGYCVGMTGKGWGPGQASGWPQNPAGVAYAKEKLDSPPGIANNDYAANFEDFLAKRDDNRPFCFWYGGHEPHRGYDRGIGKRNGMDLDKVVVPPFLPDTTEVRSDIADYLFEVEWFDQHLMRMLDRLEKLGELENTLVIVTSDNGMPFPRAKANLYEYGIHMPLAISWPARIEAGQVNDDLVGLVDVTRTIFAAATVAPDQADQLAGFNLLPRISHVANRVPPLRSAVYSGRERHSSSRFNTLGYPCRCIRTNDFLYVHNFRPERWPAGTPRKYETAKYDVDGTLVSGTLGNEHGGYHDIDSCPTLDYMIRHADDPSVATLLEAAVGMRPEHELYKIGDDPACLHNLANDAEFQTVYEDLSKRLSAYLTTTGDLRQTDSQASEIWETYPRYSPLRWFEKPQWAKDSPEKVPHQSWLDKRRPH